MQKQQNQKGLSLVELLVALVISLFIALAAIAALNMTRQGFTTLDAASQLSDNNRFATNLIRRLGVQSGYKDVWYASQGATAAEVSDNIAPNVSGFNNSLAQESDVLNSAVARTTGTTGYGSDVLIMRYQSAQLNSGDDDADASMIDCMGGTSALGATSRGDRISSILSVDVSNGEPSLMCSTEGNPEAQPIVQGVENFQVLYGVDGTSLVPNSVFTGAQDSVADAYLRADQMVVNNLPNSAATYDNWRRVRSIRIGMVLRGPPNSAMNLGEITLYPFGAGKDSVNGDIGSALSSINDAGTIFVAPADSRMRQTSTFTVHLRNEQGL